MKFEEDCGCKPHRSLRGNIVAVYNGTRATKTIIILPMKIKMNTAVASIGDRWSRFVRISKPQIRWLNGIGL